MKVSLQREFSVGDYDVQPQAGCIVGPSGVRHIPPKALELLLRLAANEGQVVDHQTLLRDVWGESGSDGALRHCVAELRSAFNDHSDQPKYIETVPKRGYRLMPVVRVSSARVPQPEQGGVGRLFAELGRRKVIRVGAAYAIAAWVIIEVSATVLPALRLPDWTVTLVVVILILGFPAALLLAWLMQVTPQGIVVDRGSVHADSASWYRKFSVDIALLGALFVTIGAIAYRLSTGDTDVERATPAITAEATISAIADNSVAVLPFTFIGSDPRDEAFSAGLVVELLDSLARLPELEVAARSASFYFQDKDLDLATIGDRLRVRYLVEGTVRREGDNIRVSATLVDAATGFRRWSEIYDRTLAEVLEIQGEIAKAVTVGIAPVISPESRARLARHPTSNMVAYELYLRGRGYLQQLGETATLGHAIEAFADSTRLDPQFALAHAGLCDAYVASYVLSNSAEYISRAESSCQLAIDLDAEVSEVRTALGNLYLHTGQPERAISEFERALSTGRDLASAHEGLGRAYELLKDLHAAEAQYRRVVELQPGYASGYFALAEFLYRRGRHSEAESIFERVTILAPDSARAFSALGATLMMQGEFESAASQFARSVQLAPTFDGYAKYGAMYYYLGRFEESVDALEKAAALAPDLHWVTGNLASAYRYVPGGEPRAEAAYRRAVELARRHLAVNPNDGDAYADLSLYYANLEDLEDARQAMRMAVELTPDSPIVHYYAALLHVVANETEAAFTELERAVELGYTPAFLAADPELATLRHNERFAQLYSRTGEKQPEIRSDLGGESQ